MKKILALALLVITLFALAIPAMAETGIPVNTTAYTQAIQVNVRSGPGTNYSSYGRLDRGTAVTILNTTYDTGGWYRVTGGGLTGYVQESYLGRTPPPPIGAGLWINSTTKFDGTSINVRESYSTSARVLYTTNTNDNNQILTVIGVSSEVNGYIWYMIKNPNPINTRPDGWVRGDYLQGTIR